jgi:hypothetical protein
VTLAPAFAATLGLYVAYPWEFTGEIVELMLGYCFLFSALAVRPQTAASVARAPRSLLTSLIGSTAVVVLLSFATAAGVRLISSDDTTLTATASVEVAALREDFLRPARPERGIYITPCGLHKRVYSYVEKYRAKYLTRGSFAGLEAQGMSTDRARYFLDPWNGPYWIRDSCDDDSGKRVIFVYSFGPNRLRDSSPWQLSGDDVGAYLLEAEVSSESTGERAR